MQLCARVAASASGPINTSSNKSIVAALLFGHYFCGIASRDKQEPGSMVLSWNSLEQHDISGSKLDFPKG